MEKLRILLTGANGYIGKRLLHVLLEAGHTVFCCVRDRNRFNTELVNHKNIRVIEIDFLVMPSIDLLPRKIDIAYYLIHSMSSSIGDFDELDRLAAENFKNYMEFTSVKQVIYLSGIVNDDHLSKHLESRREVEEILKEGTYALTTLRAGIIVGSGSASFEIIRDLVEKLPVMIAPKWILTKTHPIAIRDVLSFLSGVMLHPKCLNREFDIGGADALTYKDMMVQFAKVRGLNRWIVSVPVMTPKLSSYWLYFVTATSYKLAVNLVDSMKVEVRCEGMELEEILKIKPICYKDAVAKAFVKIKQNTVISSWKDSLSSGQFKGNISQYIHVPEFGCFKDERKIDLSGDISSVVKRIWSIGGNKGWYYADFLWKMRGAMDKLFGGIGLRRGRTHPNEINPGDSLDFWRVLLADKEEGRLLLFAEMKLPGEAWLEFRLERGFDNSHKLIQVATFRPKGILGRLYWQAVKPFHYFVFRGMLRNIAYPKKM